jgi:PAS domain-containing protein
MPWLANGATWVVNDVDTSPALPDEQRAAYRGNGIGAAVVVPLIKEARLVATFLANQDAPRDWTPQEIALVEETADRTWAAVERARAEGALRESERRRSAVLRGMDADYALLEVLLDEQGAARDLRCMEVNEAAKQLIGTDPTGRLLSEFSADCGARCLRIIGRVVHTGQPLRKVLRAGPAGCWYDLHVFKPSPEDSESREVAAIFRRASPPQC